MLSAVMEILATGGSTLLMCGSTIGVGAGALIVGILVCIKCVGLGPLKLKKQ